MVVAWGWGREGRELVLMRTVSVWKDEKVLEADGGNDCTTTRMYLMLLNLCLKTIKIVIVHDVYFTTTFKEAAVTRDILK